MAPPADPPSPTSPPASPSALTHRVKSAAHALGFDLVGIARAGAATHAEHFRAWLDRNYHGEMAYMARRAAERADPRLLVPGARSVVVVAMGYPRPDHPGVPVARYALGRDYHNVLIRRLRKLRRAWLDATGVADPRDAWVGVDTGPVLERYWAEAAGLGWIGKSGNLVTRTHSSWVLLGTMIVKAELVPDAPHRPMCGTCTACMPACPTAAIVAPGVVDARLCISYLTIEVRGAIPRALRPAVGGHLFGCDVCQDVCPWERFAPGAPNPALATRPDLAALDPRDVLRLDEAAATARFAGTPLARPGLAGLKRNALVVLGNTGGPADRDAVRACLDDPSPLVREHAVWALGRLGDHAAIAVHRGRESDPAVLQEIALTLGEADGL
jgi:epoxyqueuosine reductase